MAWFTKTKSDSGIDDVRQYSNAVYAEIEEAQKLLSKTTVFDPRNRRHLRLAELIMSLTANIPETRCADTRSLEWSKSAYPPLEINNRRMDRLDWFSYAQRITYNGQLVFEWENGSDSGEHFKTVRLGSWCNELFEVVRKIRSEIEENALICERELAARKSEFEATRFQPLK